MLTNALLVVAALIIASESVGTCSSLLLLLSAIDLVLFNATIVVLVFPLSSVPSVVT